MLSSCRIHSTSLEGGGLGGIVLFDIHCRLFDLKSLGLEVVDVILDLERC